MIVGYLKKTIKHSIVYGLAGITTSIIGFILIPIYTRVLTPEDYGTLSLVTILFSALSITFAMGLSSGLFRFYSYDYETQRDKRTLISSIFFFQTVFLVGISALLFYFSNGISELIFQTVNYSPYLKIISLTLFFEVSAIIPLSILRAQEKSKKYSFLSIFRFVTRLGLIIYFILVLKRGVLGILEATLIANILFYLVTLPTTLRNINFKPSLQKLKYVLLFSLPLVPANLAAWALTMTDRFFLEYFTTTAEVGIYTLGYSLGMIIYILIVTPFQLSWPIIMWSILKQKENKQILSYLTTYFTILAVWACTGLSLLSQDIIKIIATPDFYDAWKVITPVAFSYGFYGLYFIVSVGINLKKKTKFVPIIVVSALIINIILNFLLIPRLGIIGAAWSTLLSYLSLLIIGYLINRHFYVISYQWIRITKIISAAIIIFIINFIIPSSSLVYSLIIKILLTLIYPLILYLLKFYEPKEIKKIIGFVKLKILKMKSY